MRFSELGCGSHDLDFLMRFWKSAEPMRNRGGRPLLFQILTPKIFFTVNGRVDGRKNRNVFSVKGAISERALFSKRQTRSYFLHPGLFLSRLSKTFSASLL